MQFSQVFGSTIGKKFLLAVSGLTWAGFAIMHLIGNFQLLYSDPMPFNKYTQFLTGLGSLLYIAEFILAGTLLIHLFYAIKVTIDNYRARPQRYIVNKKAGDVSKRGIATHTMIFTGLALIVFLILHIMNFKFGTYYTTVIDGEIARDLYRTVYEYYSGLGNVIYYEIMMILLGFHLSHGFWSAFQSLGINGNRFTPFIYVTGLSISIVVSAGFILIPIYIYIAGGAA
jgi:succinate dehydrogenase / fumarate reductase cytochrome b subunit